MQRLVIKRLTSESALNETKKDCHEEDVFSYWGDGIVIQ